MEVSINELKARQAWTLSQKIDHALGTIEAFVSRMGGPDKVYCSFSGGKDSTVLLHLCRFLFPDILAVFCSTGNEYPEIIQFVNQQRSNGVNIHIRWLARKPPTKSTKYDITHTVRRHLPTWGTVIFAYLKNGGI